MPLDRKRPFAQICPPEKGVGFEQDGKSFNPSGFEIDPKTQKLLEEPVEPGADQPDVPIPVAAIRELLGQADKLPFSKFVIKAALALRAEPPSNKKDVIRALKARADALEEAAKPVGPPPSADIDL